MLSKKNIELYIDIKETFGHTSSEHMLCRYKEIMIATGHDIIECKTIKATQEMMNTNADYVSTMQMTLYFISYEIKFKAFTL